MARARGIKPGFFRNADLVELPVEARLLFIGLWTIADREGRLEDRPKQIKMELFPADDFSVAELLDQIVATGMLVRYSHGAKRYLQVTNFTKHQNPHRDERPSTIPAPWESGEIAPAEPPKTVCASEQQDAQEMQTLCEHGASTVQNGLTPDSGLLTPDSRLLIPDSPTTHTSSLPREGDPPAPVGTRAGAVCVVLKSEGIGSVNPQHPDLLALLGLGAEVGLFCEAAKTAVTKKKPTFAYVLGIVKRQLQDAGEIAGKAMEAGAQAPPRETDWQRSQRERVAAFAPSIARKSPSAVQASAGIANVITLESSHVAIAQSH